MNKMFLRLQEQLNKQNNIIQQLLLLGERESEALVKNDIQLLTEVVHEQEQVGVRLIEIEKERLILQEDMAEQLSLNKNVSLRQLIKSSSFQSDALIDLADTLKTNYLQLQELNETNRMLIKQSLVYVNKMLSTFMPQNETTYQNSGMVKTAANSSTIDKSV